MLPVCDRPSTALSTTLFVLLIFSGAFPLFATPANSQVAPTKQAASFKPKGEITYVESIPVNSRVIDTRAKSECRKSSLEGAVCLPVSSILATHQRLANYSGLLWKLGTAGLDGSEHVIVVGQTNLHKDFMAGVLYLAGQRKVSVLRGKVTDKLSSDSGPGRAAATTRTRVWQAAMRSGDIVLHDDMQQLVASGTTRLLDGRPENEYWGKTVRGLRGGHIPGADFSPYTDWGVSAVATPQNPALSVPLESANDGKAVIVYAADPMSSIAFFSRVIAAGFPARVYIDGWRRWAAESGLPVDAETYYLSNSRATKNKGRSVASASPVVQEYAPYRRILWLVAISVALAFACGYIVAKHYYRKG